MSESVEHACPKCRRKIVPIKAKGYLRSPTRCGCGHKLGVPQRPAEGESRESGRVSALGMTDRVTGLRVTEAHLS